MYNVFVRLICESPEWLLKRRRSIVRAVQALQRTGQSTISVHVHQVLIVRLYCTKQLFVSYFHFYRLIAVKNIRT